MTITDFTPWTALLGGILIGTASAWALAPGILPLSLPVPFGLLAGGYARSQQSRGRGLGAICAALAVAIAFVARLSLASAP